MKRKFLATILMAIMVFSMCVGARGATIVEPGFKVVLPANSLIVDGGFETATILNPDNPATKKSYIPTFTATEDKGLSTERAFNNAQIISDAGMPIEGKQCILLKSGENATIALPNLYNYKGGKLKLTYYVRAKVATTGYGTWGKLEDRSVQIPDENDPTITRALVVADFKDGINYWTQPGSDTSDDTSFDKVWTCLTEEIVIPDSIQPDNEYVLNFGAFGNSLYYDAISCVLYDAAGREVSAEDVGGQVVLPTATIRPSETVRPTFKPANPFGFIGGTVLTTHDGSPVTLLPDYDPDRSKARAAIRDGGFETKAAFNDDLQLPPYWVARGMTYEETDSVEGKLSLVVDYPKITEEARGEAAFTGVYLAPCFDDEAYCLEFYTKLLTPLDGNINILIYFIDNNVKTPVISVGSDRFLINAETMKNSEWEDQKWIRVRHYFVVDKDSEERAFTMQIQNMNFQGPWGTSRIALDGFSLTKVEIDKETMDASLFESVATPAPSKSAVTTPAPTAPATQAPQNPVSGEYQYKMKSDGTVEIVKYTGKASILEIPAVIDGYMVTQIGEGAFENNDMLESVIIPDTVKVVGINAFSSCRKMVSVNVGRGVEMIDKQAFFNCSALALIAVPESVKYIGPYALGYDSSYNKIFGFSITGYSGTEAENYCKNNGITFNDLDANIKKPVKKSIKFIMKSVKIKKGKKVTLKVKLTGAKKAVFSVDKKGKKVVKLMKKKAKSVVVKGKKKGKATITAKAAGKKAKCKVTVR